MSHTQKKLKVDIREEIIEHCMHCFRKETNLCERCFFGSVNIADATLGNQENYERAFRYLRCYQTQGFKRTRPFGSFLNIPVKEIHETVRTKIR